MVEFSSSDRHIETLLPRMNIRTTPIYLPGGVDVDKSVRRSDHANEIRFVCDLTASDARAAVSFAASVHRYDASFSWILQYMEFGTALFLQRSPDDVTATHRPSYSSAGSASTPEAPGTGKPELAA